MPDRSMPGHAVSSRQDDPKSGFYKPSPSPHGVRAIELLERALSEIRDGLDAIPTISEAFAHLKAEVGEVPAAEATELLAEDGDRA